MGKHNRRSFARKEIPHILNLMCVSPALTAGDNWGTVADIEFAADEVELYTELTLAGANGERITPFVKAIDIVAKPMPTLNQLPAKFSGTGTYGILITGGVFACSLEVLLQDVADHQGIPTQKMLCPINVVWHDNGYVTSGSRAISLWAPPIHMEYGDDLILPPVICAATNIYAYGCPTSNLLSNEAFGFDILVRVGWRNGPGSNGRDALLGAYLSETS